MLFSVSHLMTDVPQPYVMLEASQLDSYGLQFAKPTFISLDPNATVTNVPIAGIRIGVNGADDGNGPGIRPAEHHHRRRQLRPPAPARRSPTRSAPSSPSRRARPTTCTSCRSSRSAPSATCRPDPVVMPPAAPADSPAESDVGLRTFDEINATLSLITGVSADRTRACAAPTTLVKQALPSIEKFGAFGPSQQTGLAQLAIQYCNVMVDTPALRTAFFGGSLNPSSTATATFGSAGSPNAANRDLVIDALLTKGVNTGLEWNPDDDGRSRPSSTISSTSW